MFVVFGFQNSDFAVLSFNVALDMVLFKTVISLFVMTLINYCYGRFLAAVILRYDAESNLLLHLRLLSKHFMRFSIQFFMLQNHSN